MAQKLFHPFETQHQTIISLSHTTMPLTTIDSECEGWNKVRNGKLVPPAPGKPVGLRCLKNPPKKHLTSATTALSKKKCTKTNAAGVDLLCRFVKVDTPVECKKFMGKGVGKVKPLSMNEADTLATFVGFFESLADALAYKEYWIKQNPDEDWDEACLKLTKDLDGYYKQKSKKKSDNKRKRNPGEEVEPEPGSETESDESIASNGKKPVDINDDDDVEDRDGKKVKRAMKIKLKIPPSCKASKQTNKDGKSHNKGVPEVNDNNNHNSQNLTDNNSPTKASNQENDNTIRQQGSEYPHHINDDKRVHWAQRELEFGPDFHRVDARGYGDSRIRTDNYQYENAQRYQPDNHGYYRGDDYERNFHRQAQRPHGDDMYGRRMQLPPNGFRPQLGPPPPMYDSGRMSPYLPSQLPRQQGGDPLPYNDYPREFYHGQPPPHY